MCCIRLGPAGAGATAAAGRSKRRIVQAGALLYPPGPRIPAGDSMWLLHEDAMPREPDLPQPMRLADPAVRPPRGEKGAVCRGGTHPSCAPAFRPKGAGPTPEL